MLLMGPDELAAIEGDVDLVRRLSMVDDTGPIDVLALCKGMKVPPPRIAPMRQESCAARVKSQWRVYLRPGLLPARARWLACHELGEIYYQRLGHSQEDIEARCDLFGAALLAPWRAVRALLREGATTNRLAKALGITESTALLRVGEVSGRPVALVRSPASIVRGDAFEWPAESNMLRTALAPPPELQAVRVADEPARFGLMAA